MLHTLVDWLARLAGEVFRPLDGWLVVIKVGWLAGVLTGWLGAPCDCGWLADISCWVLQEVIKPQGGGKGANDL